MTFGFPLGQRLDNPDATLYAKGVAEIRQRIGIARKTVAHIREKKEEDVVSVETIFLQLRKVCELIAFGSLIANRDLYAAQYKEFAEDWRLKRMVERLKKLNPDFFPVPVATPVRTGPDSFHLGHSVASSLAESELVPLYDTCGKILHSRNPFSTEAATHNIGYSVDEWLARLEGLMRWHYITQVNSSRWLVEMPDSGLIHVYPSIPTP